MSDLEVARELMYCALIISISALSNLLDSSGAIEASKTYAPAALPMPCQSASLNLMAKY